jgi:hypothetical protein
LSAANEILQLGDQPRAAPLNRPTQLIFNNIKQLMQGLHSLIHDHVAVIQQLAIAGLDGALFVFPAAGSHLFDRAFDRAGLVAKVGMLTPATNPAIIGKIVYNRDYFAVG